MQGTNKVTVNFKEKKDPQESRKQTPTQYQEKGTTDVFNRVLDEDKRYASVEDMKKDKKLMNDLRDTFSGKTAKKNVGDHRDKICLLYTSPSPRDLSTSRMPSSA